VTVKDSRSPVVNPSPTIPAVMPWRYAITICAAALVLGSAGYAIIGSAGSMAAMSGFAVGLFAALSGGLRGVLVAALGFIAAVALLMAFPVLQVLLAICITLAALAAIEVAWSGTRVAIMVLMGVILFAIAIAQSGDARMLALAALGLGIGYLAILHLHLSSILRGPLANRAGAVRLGLFLAIGVVLSISLAMTLNLPHAYWIVILFVSRCLMPMQDGPDALFKYGHGAALGVLAAIAIELARTPDALRLLLALAAFVLGLRFIPHPLPISAAAMTAGILLATAPTPGAATFRVEIVLLVIALILFLTLILEQVVPRLPDAKPEKTDKVSLTPKPDL